MRTLFFVLGLLLPNHAIADPIVIRSGEHPLFTRIVAPLEGSKWSVTRSAREVVVKYSEPNDGFQTNTIFNLIPKNRISSVLGDGNKFTVGLACDCAVSARTVRGSFIVIDVANLSENLETPQHEIIDFQATQPAKFASSKAATIPAEFLQENADSTSALSFPIQPLPNHTQHLIAEFRTRLDKKIQLATEDGELSRDTFVSAKNQLNEAIPLGSRNTNVYPTSIQTNTFNESNLSEHFNQRRSLQSPSLPARFRTLSEKDQENEQDCQMKIDLDVSNWGSAEPFDMQISEIRKILYGPLGQVDNATAIQLAKLYIYFGFGAEALETLQLISDSAIISNYLTILSYIIDSRPDAIEDSLFDTFGCTDERDLWTTLVAPIPARGVLGDPNNTLKAFNELPPHLRKLLGPRLHDILVAYGNPTEAAAALRSIDRLGKNERADALIATSPTPMKFDDIAKAEGKLLDAVRKNTSEAPLALITLVEAKMNLDTPISSEIMSLIEAYSVEFRGTQIGLDLLRTQILALAHSSRFDEAFRLLSINQTSLRVNLTAKIFSQLIANANDIIFLEYAIELSEDQIREFNAEDILDLGERFLRLGFAFEAERIVNLVPENSVNIRQILLSARISLALEKPFRVEADLLNVEGEAADLLRANAKRKSGLYSDAHAIYDALGQEQDASETAWLADEWRTLLSKDAPVFGPSVEALKKGDSEVGPNPSLARSSALIKKSVEIRSTLQNLLKNTEIAEAAEDK